MPDASALGGVLIVAELVAFHPEQDTRGATAASRGTDTRSRCSRRRHGRRGGGSGDTSVPGARTREERIVRGGCPSFELTLRGAAAVRFHVDHCPGSERPGRDRRGGRPPLLFDPGASSPPPGSGAEIPGYGGGARTFGRMVLIPGSVGGGVRFEGKNRIVAVALVEQTSVAATGRTGTALTAGPGSSKPLPLGGGTPGGSQKRPPTGVRNGDAPSGVHKRGPGFAPHCETDSYVVVKRNDERSL